MKPLVLFAIATLALATSTRAADDLAPLGDEFNHGPTITNWQRVYQTEGWGNNVLQQFDINATRPGRMFMRPYSSVWYAEHRGELAFKEPIGRSATASAFRTRTRASSPTAPRCPAAVW